jgi:Na+/melibiose symporter-like transporter
MPAELEYYKEHVSHGRHIEVQRSTVAGVAITAAGAIVGSLLKVWPPNREQLPLAVVLTVLGLFSLVLTAKLYERFKLHNAIARNARNKLDPSLATLRRQAEEEIKHKFPLLFRLPLHIVWSAVFVAMVAFGAIQSCLFTFRRRLAAPKWRVGVAQEA